MSDNNLYSLDKLVAFGMGLSIATQMAASMNHTLSQTQIPGAGTAMSTHTETVYYAVLDGVQAGPYSLTEVARLIAEKKIVKETYVWKPGMAKWDLAENVDEVLRLVALTPPPLPTD